MGRCGDGNGEKIGDNLKMSINSSETARLNNYPAILYSQPWRDVSQWQTDILTCSIAIQLSGGNGMGRGR
jgi:hypothetical protein